MYVNIYILGAVIAIYPAYIVMIFLIDVHSSYEKSVCIRIIFFYSVFRSRPVILNNVIAKPNYVVFLTSAIKEL